MTVSGVRAKELNQKKKIRGISNFSINIVILFFSTFVQFPNCYLVVYLCKNIYTETDTVTIKLVSPIEDYIYHL